MKNRTKWLVTYALNFLEGYAMGRLASAAIISSSSMVDKFLIGAGSMIACEVIAYHTHDYVEGVVTTIERICDAID